MVFGVIEGYRQKIICILLKFIFNMFYIYINEIKYIIHSMYTFILSFWNKTSLVKQFHTVNIVAK